jgi:hypothetical protein
MGFQENTVGVCLSSDQFKSLIDLPVFEKEVSSDAFQQRVTVFGLFVLFKGLLLLVRLQKSNEVVYLKQLLLSGCQVGICVKLLLDPFCEFTPV